MIRAEDKIFDPEALAERLSEVRGGGGRVVFTNGCFDLVHVGHARYLAAARAEGECLVVAVNSDDSMRRIKGPDRPILPADQRKRVLASFACVDFVTEFGEETPHNLLRLLKPELLVKGANYTVDGVVGRELVEAYGGRVVTLELTEGRSTTGIIERIGAEA